MKTTRQSHQLERQKTLEVIVSFDGAVLGVHHLRAGSGPGKEQALRLGPPDGDKGAPRPDYALGELPAALAAASAGAVNLLIFPTGAEGAVTLPDGARRSLAELRQLGLCEAVAGGLRYALPEGAVAEWALGAFSLRISETVLEARTVPARAAVDWRSHRFAAASLLLHGGVIGLALLAPPDPRALASNDLSRLDNETLRTRFIPAQVELKLQPKEPGQESGGAAPKALRGPSGRVGHQAARDRSLQTVRVAQAPQKSGADLQAVVKNSGVLAILGQNAMQGVLSTVTDRSQSALGKDAQAVLAGLQATTDHDGWGVGGGSLVDSGAGPGGGCVGPDCGTVAVGAIGGCDGGTCKGSDGRGRRFAGPALTARSHRPEVPPPQLGIAHVIGGMDKEIIRRVIRSRMNEFKFCYEKELTRQPELAGRVVMSFVISKDGRVVTAAAKESTLTSPAVHGCLSQAVSRLSFPQPEGGGLVQVSYPFVFHTAEK